MKNKPNSEWPAGERIAAAFEAFASSHGGIKERRS